MCLPLQGAEIIDTQPASLHLLRHCQKTFGTEELQGLGQGQSAPAFQDISDASRASAILGTCQSAHRHLYFSGPFTCRSHKHPLDRILARYAFELWTWLQDGDGCVTKEELDAILCAVASCQLSTRDPHAASA